MDKKIRLEPRPLWLLPVGWNPNEAEGRAAFAAGLPVDGHGYGESSAAKDFERAWRYAELRAREKSL